jgi:hypothetical protein
MAGRTLPQLEWSVLVFGLQPINQVIVAIYTEQLLYIVK